VLAASVIAASAPLACAAAASDASAEPATGDARPVREVERLDRGVVAVPLSDGRVYVGWRLLGLDPSGIGFDVYRAAGSGEPVK
ncbi:hypothetical protein R0K19_25935, partial [Bacillus sp. SIMBA_161]